MLIVKEPERMVTIDAAHQIGIYVKIVMEQEFIAHLMILVMAHLLHVVHVQSVMGLEKSNKI